MGNRLIRMSSVAAALLAIVAAIVLALITWGSGSGDPAWLAQNLF